MTDTKLLPYQLLLLRWVTVGATLSTTLKLPLMGLLLPDWSATEPLMVWPPTARPLTGSQLRLPPAMAQPLKGLPSRFTLSDKGSMPEPASEMSAVMLA